MIKDNETLNQLRQLSYLMNDWDDVSLKHEINYNNIEEQIVNFFVSESQLIYPAKSYFVAIVYAKCLEKYFKIPFYEALDYDDLLYDDKYFVKYSDSKHIYDNIIKRIGDIWQYKSIDKTVDYFKKEFLV
jgi:hypothetical protein